MKSTFDFMESPLVLWAKSILNSATLEFDKFPNGEYFYLILKQSDPRLQNSNSDLPNEGEPYDTTRSRLLNLDFILRNIRSFYQEILNHILLIKLPDIYQIAKYPESEETFKEMEKMLLLLLGLAINGEFKERFIEQIQQNLETQVQIQLVPFIQLVTEDLSFSISKSLLLQINSNGQKSHLKPGALNVELYETIQQPVSPRDSSTTSNVSSTTSFTQACQQLSNQHNAINAGQSNQLVLNYQSIEQFNYFVNKKLMPNMQRIVDERDSYLESIIELEQDKDYLAYKLNNSPQCQANSNDGTTQNGASTNQAAEGADSLKNFNINELIMNLVSNSSTICNITSENNCKIDPSTGLIDLNETNMKLLKLIDSLSKNEQITGSSEAYYNTVLNDIDADGQLYAKTKGLLIGEAILSDLKNKKELANNWNQKIAIELVECKIRLKQLINEIEEKCECIESLKDEMDDVRKQFNKLRNENVDLQQKAALANVYADELESLREKSLKVDRYECELAKMKERIDELQIDETRLHEFKEENLILTETRSFMEKQLEEYQQRLIGSQRLDSDLNKYKQDIDDLNKQSDMDKRRMCELCEKNAKLELEMKNLLNQNVNLDEELNYYKQKYTFTSAELTKQQQIVSNVNKTMATQNTQLIEMNKIKLAESVQQIKELNSLIKVKDQELSRLKENSRSKEIRNDECMAKLKALDAQLNIEQDNKMKLERVLDQHKSEIKDLQNKLDDCVNETKKLDHSIRAAAKSNEIKTTENEENFGKLVESHEQLNQSYKNLLNDHEQLQKLYLTLENEYDELYNELTKKNSMINGINGDFDELNMKYTGSLDMIDNLEKKLKSVIEKDVKNMSTETEKIGDTEAKLQGFYQEKLNALNNEISELDQKQKDSESEMKALTENLKISTEELAATKDSEQRLSDELSKQQENFQMQFMQMNQLNGKIQALEILNEKLEDEKSQLFEQLHMLLQQNQEILTQTLTNKDLYHEETKAYMQQLNNLKRQKEILEQKIMEQYKNCPSLTQKPKNKKSIQSQNMSVNSNGSNLIDMVSKTTRNLVQKVRNKSTTSLNQHPDISMDHNLSSYLNSDIDHTDQSDINIYENVNFLNRSNSKTSFCHKYSADDINYLNLQSTLEKEIGIVKPENIQANTNRNTVSSLSSSSSTSSSSSASSSSSSASSIPQINFEPNQLITKTPNKCLKQQSSGYIINQITTPVKYDPKSLKLGGRPQSICSSICPSPHATNSPPNGLIKKSQNDYKRVMLTSSPLYQNKNVQIQPTNYGTNSQSDQIHSSSSSSSPSSVSSSSMTPKQSHLTPTKSSTPIKSSQQPILLSSLSTKSSPIAKKNLNKTLTNSLNGPSSLLMSTPTPVKSQQKITQRIAHELSKFRMSAQLADNEMPENVLSSNHDNEDDCLSTVGGLSKNSNEIWLEYGCI